jgi:F-type H+-transporting ATPase subunit alpha
LADNVAAYIPTNLISITDGQIILSSQLFGRGFLPAVDIGLSVSRVGSKAQPPAYAQVAGDMKIAYSQFLELETFSRFGTSIDEATRRVLARGERVRETLRQPLGDPWTSAEQVVAMAALNHGDFDGIPLGETAGACAMLRRECRGRLKSLAARIDRGERLDPADFKAIAKAVESAKPKPD